MSAQDTITKIIGDLPGLSCGWIGTAIITSSPYYDPTIFLLSSAFYLLSITILTMRIIDRCRRKRNQKLMDKAQEYLEEKE